MTDKIKKGKEGEARAERFLVTKGFEIVARNYRYKRSEIDLIVKKDDWLVFVEVRMRNSSAFGYPEQTISAAKQKKVMEGAAQYLDESNWKGNVRYDVVAITKKEITHFEDAFY
jgi:putative endonuclease